MAARDEAADFRQPYRTFSNSSLFNVQHGPPPPRKEKAVAQTKSPLANHCIVKTQFAGGLSDTQLLQGFVQYLINTRTIAKVVAQFLQKNFREFPKPRDGIPWVTD